MRGTGVHHFDLVVSELDRSLEFYRGLLEPLGYTQAAAIVGERGERVVYLGGPGIVPVSLRQAQTSDRHDRYRIGVHHVAFEAPSREIVDERLRWARDRVSRSRTTRRSTHAGQLRRFLLRPGRHQARSCPRSMTPRTAVRSSEREGRSASRRAWHRMDFPRLGGHGTAHAPRNHG